MDSDLPSVVVVDSKLVVVVDSAMVVVVLGISVEVVVAAGSEAAAPSVAEVMDVVDSTISIDPSNGSRIQISLVAVDHS